MPHVAEGQDARYIKLHVDAMKRRCWDGFAESLRMRPSSVRVPRAPTGSGGPETQLPRSPPPKSGSVSTFGYVVVS